MGEVKGELKKMHEDMFEMEERMNLAMIRQFQLHQSEMKSMVLAMLSKEKEKDEMIKKLEQENARLKNSTY